jgi:hypothetical protein
MKDNTLAYPAFWQYTTHDNLQKLIPHGFSYSMLVTKEILDNACDAAERYGGNVSISLDKNILSVTNAGVIEEMDISSIADFNTRITTKYLKKSYQRGAIGHGLKIAIMLSDIEKMPVEIESGSYKHTLTLKNRKAKDAREVLSVQTQSNGSNSNTTTITVSLPVARDNARIDISQYINKYIDKYIMANPHISFMFNSKDYPAVAVATSFKNDTFLDIGSYNRSDFDNFMGTYLSAGFSLAEIGDMFNVSNAKKKKIPQIGQDRFYEFLIKHARKVKPSIIGGQTINKRLEQVIKAGIRYYKKVKLSDHEYVEFAVLDNSKMQVISVNHSLVDANMVWVTKETNKKSLNMTLANALEDLKYHDGIYFSYLTTSPSFQDINKQQIMIFNPLLFNAIRGMTKKHGKDSSDWLLKRDDYQSKAEKEGITKEWIERNCGANMQPWTYMFIADCREIAEKMYRDYGAITLRQLYYQLVSKGIIKNSNNSYKNTCEHIGNARDYGMIDYDIFDDRSRYVIFPHTISPDIPPKTYISDRIVESLERPNLDPWQCQDNYVELWIEKDALVNLFMKVGKKYHVPVFASRGYTSKQKIHEAKQRFIERVDKGKKCVILYAGDLDPSGWNIYENIANKLSHIVHVERFALNDEQALNEKLIPMPVKKSDSRTRAFLKKHKQLKGKCYELDAYDPNKLIDLASNAIKKYFDESKLIGHYAEWYKEFEDEKKTVLAKIGG